MFGTERTLKDLWCMSRKKNKSKREFAQPDSGYKPKKFVARNDKQLRLRDTILSNDITICTGPPGTGKTHVAVALGVQLLRNCGIDRLVLTRPTVETGNGIGFLPGDMMDKVSPYLRPLFDELSYYINKKHMQHLLDCSAIEVVPLCMMRGRTFINSFVILDEAQNATYEEIKMFLTRIGQGSTMVLTGDLLQSDLPSCSQGAFKNCVEKLTDIDGVGLTQFGKSDIVRHRIITDIEDRLNG